MCVVGGGGMLTALMSLAGPMVVNETYSQSERFVLMDAAVTWGT